MYGDFNSQGERAGAVGIGRGFDWPERLEDAEGGFADDVGIALFIPHFGAADQAGILLDRDVDEFVGMSLFLRLVAK